MITSLLDTDFYKHSMAQVVYHFYPGAWAMFRYQCRNGQDLPRGREREFIADLERGIRELCNAAMSEAELSYMAGLNLFKPDYVEYLRHLRLNPEYVHYSVNEQGRLDLYVEGPWVATIYFEVPLLSIISELHTRYTLDGEPDYAEGRRRLHAKIEAIREYNDRVDGPGIRFVDFGARRRASAQWEREVIQTMARELPDAVTGTSNVRHAMDYDIPAIGTMAHEFIQAHQQLLCNIAESQKLALQVWMEEYRGHLGVALSDTVGFDAFLRDFDLYFAKLYDGCRHDSGDPLEWGEKLIRHYENLGIDPMQKRMVFSDSLDVDQMKEIYDAFGDRMQVGFGWGTNLTNDIGIDPLDIVIKMVECSGRPVAKISDSPGKQMCEDRTYLAYLAQVFGIPRERVDQDFE
ncbi:MAG: nicotinate phosphoribosyltransferase [Desulfatibacillaceae bacterium]